MKEETEKALLEMANKLGTTIEHLYEVLTKQAKVWAFKAVLDCLIWSAIFIALLIFSLNQHYVSPKDSNDMFTFATFKLVLSSLITLIVGLVIFTEASDKISDIYQAIVNPEYFAITELTNLIN